MKIRNLHGHVKCSPSEMMQRASRWCEDHQIQWDVYGRGLVIEEFEQQIADLLGFEAACFFVSGTMAQVIAIRIYADSKNNPLFGLHGTSHLQLHEQLGYEHLHQLQAHLLGNLGEPFLAEHLQSAPDLCAVLVELPYRELGGVLPSFGQWRELKRTATARNVPVHLDGARLWECSSWASYEEICEGCSSAYVSFYKGVGALSGAMLLGTADFIEQAKVWQRRQGGNLYTLLPNVVTARMLFDDAIQAMPTYLERARELAAGFGEIAGVRVQPEVPSVNLFHLYLSGEPEHLNERCKAVAKETGVSLFSSARPHSDLGVCKVELYIGSSALLISAPEAISAMELLMNDTQLPKD